MGSTGAVRQTASGGGLGVGAGTNQPLPTQAAASQIVATAVQAQAANNNNFSATDSGPYKDLYGGRQYFLNQAMDIDTDIARQDYLSPNPEPGSLYSISQNLNWNLKNGINLTANQQYMSDVLSDAMHNLGYNLNLYRYDHDGFTQRLLQQVGASSTDYEKFTDTQLKNMLVGVQFGEAGFVSTSYNNFKNAPSGNPFTDREIKIVYKAPAKTQAFMPGDGVVNGRKNQLGEIILDKNQQYRITNVRFTGKMGRNKASYKKQIEFEIEIL